MSRAAHAVESKAVVRIEVAVSPRPCLGCAVELGKTFLKNKEETKKHAPIKFANPDPIEAPCPWAI
jgi:hypothetical protein